MAMRLGNPKLFLLGDPTKFQRLGLALAVRQPFSTTSVNRDDAGPPAPPPGAKPSIWYNWGQYHVPQRQIKPMPKEFKEFPERDLVNFPHEEVSLFPHGKVRLGFIPDSFFQFFYNKTGVTGPYLLGGGLVMFILQKEILPFSGQTPYIFVFGAVMWVLIRMAGANIRGWSDKQLSAQALELENWEEGLKKEYKDAIKMESELQDCYKGVGEHIFKAKKENVLFQLEAAYRERLDTAHKEVKRRLDYLVSAEEAKRRFEQKHMVNWIVDQVLKSITPDQEKAYLSQCITDLKALAPK